MPAVLKMIVPAGDFLDRLAGKKGTLHTARKPAPAGCLLDATRSELIPALLFHIPCPLEIEKKEIMERKEHLIYGLEPRRHREEEEEFEKPEDKETLTEISCIR